MLLEKVRVVLNYTKEEGLENVFKRHNRLARATVPLCRPSFYLWLLRTTQLILYRGICSQWSGIVKSLREDFGITLVGGQDQWKGKVIRIAHIGYVDTFDTVIALSALEMAMRKFGLEVQFGKGLAAAQEILLEGY